MKLRPAEPSDEEACRIFRRQIRDAGIIDPDLPFGYFAADADIEVSRQILVDDASSPAKVLGSVFTKSQRFVLRGEEMSASSGTYPISLGVVDRRYALAGVMLLRKMAEALPMSFFVGMGPPETNVTSKLCQTLGWQVSPVPYLFLPLKLAPLAAKRFSHRPFLAHMLRLAGRFGLMSPLEIAARLKAPRPRRPIRLKPVSHFDPDIDAWWSIFGRQAGFSLVRDSRQLNAIFPPSIEAFERWLILMEDRIVGYAILMIPTVIDSYEVFGAHVATLVEFSALDEAVEDAALSLGEMLRRRSFDAVIANQSHGRTVRALQGAGFQNRTTQMYLALAPALAAGLKAAELTVSDMVVGRGDGDGPIGLGVSF